MSFVDPYFDKNIGELRNLLGVKSAEELHEREPQIVFANETELESMGIPRSNDLEEVLLIHKQLFKDIYDWAGEIRTVDIRKSDENSEFFLIVSKIPDGANYIFTEFAKDKYLIGLDRGSFIKRLAYYYDQLNYIHPF
jgi:cell filamentation protein